MWFRVRGWFEKFGEGTRRGRKLKHSRYVTIDVGNCGEFQSSVNVVFARNKREGELLV